VQARSIGGRSGSIVIGGGAGGKIRVTGRLIATSRHADGGNITVTGQHIKLKGATVDASGATGGGHINIGGGPQGSGPLQHAETVSIDAATTIKADATTAGNGGNVAVWSDLLTTFAGTISAKGGAISGNGGDAEVSGKASLAYGGFTNLSAAHGTFGTLLLDPFDVTISSAADANQSGFSATGNDSIINVTMLQNALAGANVIVTTGSGGGQAGDITVAAPVSWSANSTLTLSAYRNITFNSGALITHTGSGGGLVLRADSTGTGAGTVQFASAGQVAFSGGAVSIYYNPTGDSTTVNGTKYTSATQTNFSGNVTLTGGATLTTSMLVNTVTDLQNVQNNLSGRYALGRDIDASATSGWNSGAGFVPVGTLSANFTGVLDGQGHAISNLTINRPTTDNVGLLGYTNGGVLITDIGLVGGSMTGNNHVGGLVGFSTGGITVLRSYSTGNVNGVNGGGDVGGLIGDLFMGGTVSQSYATGRISGSFEVGGLVGFLRGSVDESYATGDVSVATGFSAGGLVGISFGGSRVEQSYATGAVSGVTNVGGLIGGNIGFNGFGSVVQQSYATGAVSGNTSVGGLVGNNAFGTVSQSYATGRVTGFVNVGGLVGLNGMGFVDAANQQTFVQQSYATGAVVLTSIPDFQTFNKPFGALIGVNLGSVSGSYWNTQTSGQTVGIGVGNVAGEPGHPGGTTGLTSAQMMQQSSFSGFDFGSTWRIYEGHTVPLLKFFLTPLTVTISGGGSTTKTYDGTSASFFGSAGTLPSGINGTLGYEGAVNVGTYFVGGLYSTVFDISYAGNAGLSTALTIIPRPVTATVDVSKVYDATLGYNGPAPTYVFNNVLAADAGSLGISASILFADKNVGSNKVITAFNPMLTGNVHGNYVLNAVTSDGTSSITPLTITAGGARAASKVYDGTTTAIVSGGSLSGVFGGDTVTLSQSGSFDTKNVGMAKTVTETFGLSGTDAGNYVLASSTATTTANITAATLTVSGASAVGKVYDGTTAATVRGGSLNGVFGGDTVTLSQSGAFSDKNAGLGKTVGETFGISGADASNYMLASTSGSTTADISRAQLSVSATGVNRVYDGTTAATVTLSDNHIAGDSLTLNYGSAAFADKNAGAGKTVSVSGIGVTGADAGNYTFNAAASTTASITQRSLAVTGVAGVDKTYDGTAAAGLSGTAVLAGQSGSTGLIATDIVVLDGSGISASFADKNAGTNKTVTASGYTISGTDAGNYSFNTTATTTASIAKAALTFDAISATKIYDGTTASPSAPTVFGLRGADTVIGLSQSYDSGNAGSRVLSVNGGYAINDGNGGANYTLTIGSAAAGSITARSITVIADPQSRVVGDPNPPLTYGVGGLGLVNGDTLSGALATAATTQSVAGSYAITQGSLAASSNYALSYVGADLTVNSRPNTNIPFIVSIPAYQPPKVSSINFVTASNATDPVVTFTGSEPNTAAAPGSDTSKQTAAAPGDGTTGSFGRRKHHAKGAR
jgi:hypothetical protein